MAALLTSIMFGHEKAANVVTEIMQALENLSLPFKLMLLLEMDGPNVNKSILAKMNQLKKEKGYPELVQSPWSCLIHVCHNSFRAGLKKYGSDAEELCLNLYYFISKSPARREDLLVIEEALGLYELVLLHHVQSWWLSLVPALQCVISMKAALVKLFVDELPKNDKNITNKNCIPVGCIPPAHWPYLPVCCVWGVPGSGGCGIPTCTEADPPMNRITHTCENITLPQLHCRR